MHISVMLKELVKHMNIKPNGIYLDLTFGLGGHSLEFIKYFCNNGVLIVLDKDSSFFNLKKSFNKIRYFNLSFELLVKLSRSMNIRIYNGIITDLGLSKNQLKNNQLGLGYNQSSFLDMRLNDKQKVRVTDWINNATKKELLEVFELIGKKLSFKKFTNHIIKLRKKKYIVLSEDLKTSKNIYFNKIFYLIRLFINNEIELLKLFTKNVFFLIRKNSSIIVISFNSLEDKIIKDYVTNIKNIELLKSYNNYYKPSINEINKNLSARSAIMRIFKKL